MIIKVEWYDRTWNPIKMRCTKVSEGCLNCYADRLLSRNLPGLNKYPGPGQLPQIAGLEELNAPLKWAKPRRVFVESMGDLFHADVPEWMLDRVFDRVMHDGISCHTFIILTKRPDRMAEYFKYLDGQPVPPNVWLGVTVENQRTADERIPILMNIPTSVCFMSVEPMLERIELGEWAHVLDWVICGGETGPKARPMEPEWVLNLLAQCLKAKTPFFFKKWSAANPKSLAMPKEFPQLNMRR